MKRPILQGWIAVWAIIIGALTCYSIPLALPTYLGIALFLAYVVFGYDRVVPSVNYNDKVEFWFTFIIMGLIGATAAILVPCCIYQRAPGLNLFINILFMCWLIQLAALLLLTFAQSRHKLEFVPITLLISACFVLVVFYYVLRTILGL